MNKLLKLFCIIFSLIAFTSNAQDSAANSVVPDSINISTDSLSHKNNSDSLIKDSAYKNSVEHILPANGNISWKRDTAFTKLQNFSIQAERGSTQHYDGKERRANNEDILFYCLLFIIFFLGITKAGFPKYFNDIFSLSFQATFRQSQTREQISQNQLPGLMLNLLFVLSAGLFIALLAGYNNWSRLPFWKLFLYSSVILSLIYLCKYLFIQFTGWVFNAKAHADGYNFVVFLINKLIGILLVPLTFLIAYTDEPVKKISVTIALCAVVFLFSLRYIISMARLRKNMHITAFHFFIYLCAVEIMPMLIVYKLLFQQTGNSK